MMNERPISVSCRDSGLTIYLLLVLLFLCISCERDNQMVPLPPHFSVLAPEQVPVILVGQVLKTSHAAAPPRISEWDGRPVQLWTVRVRVEQVLQGDVQSKEVDIFYFPDMGAGESPVARVMGDLYTGHSEMFFLQRDHQKLRTICDGWRRCIMWVRTGTHYNFKADPLVSIEDNIVRLLLSRGEHTTDKQMLDAIYHPPQRWGNGPVSKALRQLIAREGSPAVRAAAQTVENVYKE
jgi:hypothetical protein